MVMKKMKLTDRNWDKTTFAEIMSPAKVVLCGNRKDLPVLSITMHDGIVEQKDRFKKVIASHDTSKYKVVKNCQLVIAFPIDEGLIYTQDIADEGIMSPAYNVWDVNYENYDRRFLGLYFHSPFAMAYYKDNLRGTTQRRRALPKEVLLSMPIPKPSLSKQKEIVEELDDINDSITMLQQQIKDLDALAQSIYINMFGSPEKNTKGLPLKTIGEICTLKSGNSEANKSKPGNLPYVKVADMNICGNETFIATSSNFVCRQDNQKDIFPIGTTIFPKRGGAILTNKKRLTKVEICCDLNIMGVIPDLNIVHPLFIYYYFLNLDFHIFANTGSTIPQINNCNIAPLKIGVPTLNLQRSFAMKIAAIEEAKSSFNAQIREMKTLLASRNQYWFE